MSFFENTQKLVDEAVKILSGSAERTVEALSKDVLARLQEPNKILEFEVEQRDIIVYGRIVLANFAIRRASGAGNKNSRSGLFARAARE